MDAQQRQHVRAIELMTCWTLVMLQNAERGLVPIKALERFVDPSVISAMGPIHPPPPGGAPFKPHVGRIRIRLAHDQLAHVACVALRADGRPAGHVLEFQRDADARQWRVTELTRVEERRLVSPDEKRYSLQGRGHRRLPADVGAVIAASERAGHEAQEALQRARDEARRLRDEIAELGTARSTWRNRERAKLRDKERAANLAVGRWERELRSLDVELEELREVQELRKARKLVADRDPLISATKAEHLERLLGPIPDDREDRKAWRRAASAVERYRQRWNVTNEDQALDELPVDAHPSQQRDHLNASVAAKKYIQRRELNREPSASSPALELP